MSALRVKTRAWCEDVDRPASAVYNHPAPMDKQRSSGVRIFSFPRLATDGGVRHFISCRGGGVSAPPRASLNLAFHVGDRPADVRENRRRLSETLGCGVGDFVFCRQVHGAGVAIVGERDRGRGSDGVGTAIPGCDAMVTSTQRLFLSVLVADCVPVLLWDPVRRAAGIVHAGWRGIAAGVCGAAVERVAAEFGSDPADMAAGIGPCIGPCCYPVGPEVLAALAADRSFREEDVAMRDGVAHPDLAAVVERRLLDARLRRGHVERTGVCTSCRRDLFFSHRAEGGVTGRFAAGIMISG